MAHTRPYSPQPTSLCRQIPERHPATEGDRRRAKADRRRVDREAVVVRTPMIEDEPGLVRRRRRIVVEPDHYPRRRCAGHEPRCGAGGPAAAAAQILRITLETYVHWWPKRDRGRGAAGASARVPQAAMDVGPEASPCESGGCRRPGGVSRDGRPAWSVAAMPVASSPARCRRRPRRAGTASPSGLHPDRRPSTEGYRPVRTRGAW
jgi:hypothetical protein